MLCLTVRARRVIRCVHRCAVSRGYALQFRRFKDVCKRAYLIVRKHANLFINLLNMMLCTGLRLHCIACI